MSSKESRINPQMITRRERAVLTLIAEGYEDQEIADELYMSERKVKENQVNLMRKLNAPNVSSIVHSALEKGLISVYEILESRFSKRDHEANC